MPREEDRIPFLTEIVLESSSGKREARISDVSPGGCYVDSIAAVQVGEPVSFYLTGKDGGQQLFAGEVAYVLDGFGFGVKFTGLNDEHRAFLDEIIRNQDA